jgi:hypothetical protein
MDVDGLPDAPHGGADEIEAFVQRLRRHLQPQSRCLRQCSGMTPD